jgi:precorrin-6B methylase 2
MTAYAEIELVGMQAALDDIVKDVALFDEQNFNHRVDAIDFIDFYIIDAIKTCQITTGGFAAGLSSPAQALLLENAESVRRKLQETDSRLFSRLREKIRSKSFTGPSFREMTGQYAYIDSPAENLSGKPGYDNFDVFVNELLSWLPLPEPVVERHPDMIFYQKTPARIIMDMIDQFSWSEKDVFFDIGAGLGQATILVNLLTDIPAMGVEQETSFCQYATSCASELNLSGVGFVNSDARNVDYSAGTVFFLYTPFEGRMLQCMLEILWKESQKRTLTIFTFGPCSSMVARETWLDKLSGDKDDFYRICKFQTIQKS